MNSYGIPRNGDEEAWKEQQQEWMEKEAIALIPDSEFRKEMEKAYHQIHIYKQQKKKLQERIDFHVNQFMIRIKMEAMGQGPPFP